nr:integrase, catalytic region, zinc finger, CCHC-type, peptidase aspartic, catalytic [Tanacetum cinerariifolium]
MSFQKINALHLSTDKQIMTLKEEISDLNKQLSKEKSTVSFILEEKKKLKSDFKTCEDELLDKQIQLEKRIKELNNILVKTSQSIQTIHMLSPKPDSFYHTEQKMALGYLNPFYLKQAQKKQQSSYDGKVLLEKHDPPVVHDSEEILQLAQETKFFRDFKSLANEADASLAKHKALELEIERLLKAVVSQDIMNIVKKKSVVDTSDLQTELEHTKERFENCIIKKENEYAKLWNDWYKKCDECKYDKILYDKAYKDMQQKIERLQAQFGDLKGKSKDASCDTSANTKFVKQPIVENLPKVGETHALSKPVTSNSVSTPQEPKCVNNDKVITPGMFMINPDKTSREKKKVSNTVSANNRTKPITVSQPPVFTKKDVNSNLNGLSSTGVDNTKTKRPQPRSNTKHDRVPSTSKSSRSKNKEAEVEEHHRNLLLSKNNKHISSACNNIKIDSQDVIPKVVCAMCKQCLISVNHDVCLRNYVYGKKSRGKKQKAKVSFKENQMKYQPKVTKPKKVGFLERLAIPKPRKPRFLLRWSPTGRLFDQERKIVDSSESESQSDCSNGDNACCSKHMIGNLKLLINFVWKFMGTVRFENDHVAAIMGFGDLLWGNILITRVYFVEGLGHNLFSVRQFCDSDLEAAFRRNDCFVRNLEGVDLLKGDRSTNLYTINLHEMASASPICLMARASSTKSWLWHQQLSHLNLDTINDLARNNLVSSLPKFNYNKEHLCPSREQGKSKRASHPPKPVPNSRQRLHLLHIDLCGPMRIASINGKMYVLVIMDDYSRYTWNDREDIGKLGAKGDIGFFIGYSVDSYAYRIYNRRTKKIMGTINVSFDELSAMAFEQRSSKPELQSMTSGQISSRLDLIYALSTITTQQPTGGKMDLLFEAMYDDYIGGQPSATARTVLPAQEPQVHQTSTASTTIADITPTPTNSSSHATNIPITSQEVDELNSNVMVDGNTFVNPFENSSTSATESSSSQNADPSNMHTNQLRSDGDMCMYALTEPKNIKEAMTDPAWIDSMQEELLQFKRLDVWVLDPAPDNISPLTLKWLFKNKHDEEQTVI